MALGKQAQILKEHQIKAVLAYLKDGRNGLRNRVIFLLSMHGLRAKEIAELEVAMVVDAEGKIGSAIGLTNKASKGRSSGRQIPLSTGLQKLLREYLGEPPHARRYVITTERSEKFSANAIAVFFKRLYSKLGYEGASSHSGRRTFITNCARRISQVGGSLRDVQLLAGHSSIGSTQRYIDHDPQAQRKLIDAIFG